MTETHPKPTLDLPSKQQLEETVLRPYSEEELSDLYSNPAIQDKIEKLMRFFDQDNLDKQAYPNYDQFMNVPGQRDTQKWLQAVKEIYHQEKEGTGRVNAIRHITSGWNPMETYDFLNWLRFYEEGAHLKYKTAQVWYENGSPGYFLHVKKDQPKPEVPGVSGHDIDFAKEDAASLSEKKEIIERQRNKIIGRLDSAEKLLRSHEGQIFAGKELESLMESIYQLKKKIQLVNKLSVSTRLYEDMIVRQANVLQKNGYDNAAYLLVSMAEDEQNNGDGTPEPAVPAPPDQPTGDPGGLPSTGPGMAQNPPESAPNDVSVIPAEMSPGLKGFLEGLETNNITDDELEIDDTMEVADIDDELLVTEAQAVPAPKDPPPKLPVEEPLEVKENEQPDPADAAKSSPQAKDFDRMIDSAFANVSIEDIIAKLEDIAHVYKTRELPRQLAIVDMMLDSLDMASLFPSLSEAMNRSLDSSNYILSRVEDILSRLRGATENKGVNLKGEPGAPIKPEVANVKQNLQQQDEKEKARKQMRKDLESQELDNATKETPEVDIKGDLGAPVATPPAAPTAPAPPPAP